MSVLAGEIETIRKIEEAGYPRNLPVQKRSRQRDAVLKVLRSTTSHPTAAWLYDEVRKELPNISLGTIYRNLRLLLECGEISELEIDGSGKRFDANIARHYHFRCDRCGQISDIEDSATQTQIRQIFQETGFEILESRVEFHGLCPACR